MKRLLEFIGALIGLPFLLVALVACFLAIFGVPILVIWSIL